MTDETTSPTPPDAVNERAEARRLFAAAQERSAAAEYAEAMRLLKQIPPSYRGSDHERIVKQVKARYAEIEELRTNILEGMKKSKSPDVLLPMVGRLVELKPGDEWSNDLRHRLETQQQEEASSPSRFSLGFGKSNRLEPQPLDEPEAEIVLEPIDSPDGEIEDYDEIDPVELVPVRPPALPTGSRNNGEQLQRPRRPSDELTADETRSDPGQPRKSKPPPLPPDQPPTPATDYEDSGVSQMTKIVLIVLLFVVLAAISVALGIVLVKGPDGLTSAAAQRAIDRVVSTARIALTV